MVRPPGAGNVEIRYTGLSFVAPGWVRFGYLLEGFDLAWQDARTRVVLMDINLPGMSGVECARRLKEALPQTQVVMLTVQGRDEGLAEKPGEPVSRSLA